MSLVGSHGGGALGEMALLCDAWTNLIVSSRARLQSGAWWICIARALNDVAYEIDRKALPAGGQTLESVTGGGTAPSPKGNMDMMLGDI